MSNFLIGNLAVLMAALIYLPLRYYMLTQRKSSAKEGSYLDKKNPEVDLKRYNFAFINLGLVVVLGLSLSAFEYASVNRSYEYAEEELAYDMDDEDENIIQPIEQKVPPKPKMRMPEPEEVTDDKDLDNLHVDMNVEVDDDTKIITHKGNNFGIGDPDLPTPDGLPDEEVVKIFYFAEEMPMPVGGMKAFRKYLRKNLNYPRAAKKAGIQGKVQVAFDVMKDGSIQNVRIKRGVNNALDAEAMRVIKAAPKWSPGKQRGKPVNVTRTIPIEFKLRSR